jgi:predicted nucleic acid-binding protein
MSLEPGILDANIPVYAMASEAPQHPASRALLDGVRAEPAVTFYVTSQILCEFYSIVTNPRRITVPRSSADALTAIEGFPGFLKVLPVPVSAVESWMNLLRQRPVTGADIFDLQLIAVMFTNKVTTIYTYNRADFQPFPELTVKEP